MADRIAFGLVDWSPDPRISECLGCFRRLQEGIEACWQVIHGDVSGNFLMQDDLPPAIIDFTPKWSPSGFGEAVMAVDVTLWEGVPWEDVAPFLTPNERQLVPLAAARRLLEVDTRHKMLGLADDVFDQVAAYEGLAKSIS